MYTYTAVQTDAAGNTSVVSAPFVVTINTSETPPAVPMTPTLSLMTASPAGSNVTSARQPFFSGQTSPNAFVHLLNSSGQVVGGTQADGTGGFSVQLNRLATDGFATFQAQAFNNAGQLSALSASTPAIDFVTVPGDYTGAGKTTPTLFRQTSASSLQWFVLFDAAINGRSFGASSTDVPLVGDFDGSGKDDLVTYTASTGNWMIESPLTNYTPQVLLSGMGAGASGVYIPTVLTNFYGTGKDQAAAFETTTGKWIIEGQSAPVGPITPFVKGMVPVPGNYDNTGQDELAVYNPSNATWYINGPTGVRSFGFGGNGDIPEPGDYFATATNQAVTEAVWRPSLGAFLIHTPSGGTKIDQFAVGDIPAPGDYDGIGMTEAAVYRPSVGEFFVMGPNDTSPRAVSPAGFGGANFVPVNAPYPYRALKSGGGLISAFSVPAGGLDLASTAVSFSSSNTVLSNGPTPGKAAVTPAAPTVIRVLPNQAMDLTTNPVETALSSLYTNRSRRLFGSSS